MKNSNNKFAIVIDDHNKVPSLIEVIRELGLIERSHKQQVSTSLLPVKKVLVFDGKKENTWDYEIEDNNPSIESWLNEFLGKKPYRVSNNLDVILNELYLFAGKENKKKKKDMTIDITISVPVRSKPKRKVRVFSNFVKVGWDQYSIKVDPYTRYEYVIIKGNRYEVVRDIFGKGYLVEL